MISFRFQARWTILLERHYIHNFFRFCGHAHQNLCLSAARCVCGCSSVAVRSRALFLLIKLSASAADKLQRPRKVIIFEERPHADRERFGMSTTAPTDRSLRVAWRTDFICLQKGSLNHYYHFFSILLKTSINLRLGHCRLN